jgi:membrane-bound inhibitor of C-type lysozyme
VAVDSLRKIVFVACTSRVQVLDAGHDGTFVGQLDTGAGVDNIDYVEATRTLYVAAGKGAQLTLARLSDQGQLSVLATGVTAAGARNAVADANGNAYVVDSIGARLLVFAAPK